MSLWPDKFGAIGLSQATSHDAVRIAGSFMLKARELQQSVYCVFLSCNALLDFLVVFKYI